MRTFRSILRVAVVAALAAVVMVACSKKEEELPPPLQKATHPEPTPKPAHAPAPRPAPPVAVKPMPTPPPVTQMAAPTKDPAQQVAALETAYVANPDFTKRVEMIYQLSDVGTPAAIAALGRIFQMEKDPELKVEVLDSLFDIDEQDDRKAVLFAAGASSDQPKEVRESAIDGLGDIDAKHALPILQALVNDPDPDIREQAKDQIEMLQSEQALQK